jgi:hypothetical protein
MATTAAATAVLLPRATRVVIKTPAATAMAGAKTTRKRGGCTGVAASLAAMATATAWRYHYPRLSVGI